MRLLLITGIVFLVLIAVTALIVGSIALAFDNDDKKDDTTYVNTLLEASSVITLDFFASLKVGDRVLDLATFNIFVFDGEQLILQKDEKVARNTPIFVTSTGNFIIENEFIRTQTNTSVKVDLNVNGGLQYVNNFDLGLNTLDANLGDTLIWNGKTWSPTLVASRSLIVSRNQDTFALTITGPQTFPVVNFSQPALNGTFIIAAVLRANSPNVNITLQIENKTTGQIILEEQLLGIDITLTPFLIRSVELTETGFANYVINFVVSAGDEILVNYLDLRQII